MAGEGEGDSSFEQLPEAHDASADAPAGPWRGPQVKLNKFSGSRPEYRGWRDEVQALLMLHSVPDDKQVLLLYLALEAGKGKPRDLFASFSVDELAVMPPPDMWKKLNHEYLEESYVEADEALADYEKCKRLPMQSMRDYLMALRSSRVRMEKEDPGSKVSDLSYARRMLRRSGLTRMEQRQVLGTAGAAWDAGTIEKSLTMMYGDAHLDDRSRMKSFDGQGPRSHRSVSSAGSGFSRGRQSFRGSSSRGGRGFRGTFAAGINESDELGYSEESDAEETPLSRSPQRAADDGSHGAPAASAALHVDEDPEEDEDARLLIDSDDSLGTPVRRKNSAAFENVSGWSCVSAGGRAVAGGRVLV